MKRKYGYDWPDNFTDPYIDLWIAKKFREMEHLNGNRLEPREHMLRAMRALFSKETMIISPWTEEHVEDWVSTEFCVIWGCASSGKSNDIGCLALLDWITDPTQTLTLMVSTSLRMLKQRNYEAVLRYFYELQKNPYFEVPVRLAPGQQSMALVYESGDPLDMNTEKASLRGVAVKEGSSERVRSNLQGAHLPFLRYIIDEMDLVSAQIMDARFNLRKGVKDFKFVGLANPESFNHLSAQFAEPKDGGWMSIDENTGVWESRFGRVRHHNGFHSPAIKEPLVYPHLITMPQIQKDLDEERGNADSRKIWTMVRGFPMRAGVDPTVLTELDIQMFGARNPPTSDDRVETNPIRFAGLDASYSEGGDGCLFQMGALIPVKGLNLWAIGLLDPVYLEIKVSAKLPIIYQISEQAIALMRLNNISAGMLAVDDSGTQSLADVLTEQLRAPVLRAQFGGTATERPMSFINKTPAKERYENFGTELWCLPAEYVRSRQLVGLGQVAAKQYTTRLLTSKKSGSGRMLVEPKDKFKARTKQRSPDEADAVGLCCWVARDVLGFLPGGPWTGNGAVRWQGLSGLPGATSLGGGPLSMSRLSVLESKYVDDVVPSGYSSFDSQGGGVL